jgi:adhesin transport system membrane fusion protein
VSWIAQAKVFFEEIKATKAQESQEQESVTKDDMEFVSSASEARLLAAPQGASFLIVLAFFATIAIIIWSLLMSVDEVAKAQGKVIPSRQVQLIQTLEGGIVKEIKVLEGQTVQKGETLLVIDDVYAKSDVTENVNAYNRLLARFVTLTAGLDGKRFVKFPVELEPHLEIISQARKQFNADWEETIAKVKEDEFLIEQRRKEYESAINEKKSQEQNYALAKEELSLNEPLLKSGAISHVEILHIKQRVNDAHAKLNQAKSNVPKAKAALNEALQKKQSYMSETRARFEKERNEVKSKLNAMQSKGVSLKAKLSHSIVKSPVTGTVKKINFNTIGGVIRPGMEVMQVVPSDDKLLIEVKIKPKDIGFIALGQKAKVKVTAFDFSTYGGLEGKVKFISADTITDKKGNSFYLARILTDTNEILDKKGQTHTIIPGMKTEVDIILDKKSILAYIFKPMLK